MISRATAAFGSMCLLAGLGLVAPGAAAQFDPAPPATPGALTAGDPYFPRQGNGGYDARAYSIKVKYQPARRHLKGWTRISATATQSLSRFSLDLRRTMVVDRVRVNGNATAYRQPKRLVQKLVITPRQAIRAGRRFVVTVRYAGTATPVTDPDGALDGWIPTNDGAYVASEPQGSPTWFPVNDSPADKARFAVSVTVPRGLQALANGELQSVTRGTNTTTWAWRMREPISSYLVTATNGKFRLSRGRTASGIPYVIALDPSQRKQSLPVVAKLPRMVEYFARVYGPYPFSSAGAVVDYAPNVGYALETATKPVYDKAPDEATVAHEIAHQWYGNDVTLRRWRDIWVNEGFAEFSAWLWAEHTGGPTARQMLRWLLRQPADSEVWNPPPGNPGGPANLFADSVYVRGAGTLQALREKLGGRVFFAIMRDWVAAHHFGNATVPQFTRFAEQRSGQDLDRFFHRWLYRPRHPVRTTESASALSAAPVPLVQPGRGLR